jgi:hypothetical protein
VREVRRPRAAWIGLIVLVSLETYALALIYCHSLHNEPTRSWLASAIYTAIALPLVVVVGGFLLSLAAYLFGVLTGLYREVDGKEGFYWWGYKGAKAKAEREEAERVRLVEGNQRRAEAHIARMEAKREAEAEATRARTKRETVNEWLDPERRPPGV